VLEIDPGLFRPFGGFIQFTVDESAGLVRVYDLVWIG